MKLCLIATLVVLAQLSLARANADDYPVSGIWAAFDPADPKQAAQSCASYHRNPKEVIGNVLVFRGARKTEFNGGYLEEETVSSPEIKKTAEAAFRVSERFYDDGEGGKRSGYKTRGYTLTLISPKEMEIREGSSPPRKYVTCNGPLQRLAEKPHNADSSTKPVVAISPELLPKEIRIALSEISSSGWALDLVCRSDGVAGPYLRIPHATRDMASAISLVFKGPFSFISHTYYTAYSDLIDRTDPSAFKINLADKFVVFDEERKGGFFLFPVLLDISQVKPIEDLYPHANRFLFRLLQIFATNALVARGFVQDEVIAINMQKIENRTIRACLNLAGLDAAASRIDRLRPSGTGCVIGNTAASIMRAEAFRQVGDAHLITSASCNQNTMPANGMSTTLREVLDYDYERAAKILERATVSASKTLADNKARVVEPPPSTPPGNPDDVVAQVLNYSTWGRDDGVDDEYWYQQSKCVYRLAKKGPQGIAQPDRQLDLNALDPRNISFEYGTLDAGDRAVAQILGNAFGGLLDTPAIATRTYHDGQIIAYARSKLNLERLQRGWELIYSKFCTGKRKAF